MKNETQVRGRHGWGRGDKAVRELGRLRGERLK